jgi:hypothetical protein
VVGPYSERRRDDCESGSGNTPLLEREKETTKKEKSDSTIYVVLVAVNYEKNIKLFEFRRKYFPLNQL